MGDIVDRAQALTEAVTRDAIAAVTANRPRGESARLCVECGEPIPEGRRRALPGVKHCIECAA